MSNHDPAIETVIENALVECGLERRGIGYQVEIVLAALKDARIAVIELPEPSRGGAEPEWMDGDVWAHPGSGKVRCFLEDTRLTADNAQELAAALLAAAAAAVGARITVEEA